MTSVAWTLLALAAMAAALACAIAWGRPSYRPVAWLLTTQIGIELTRLGLRELVFVPHYPRLGGAAATGWLRVAAHVEQALFIGWRAGIAALTVWVFGGRRPWGVAAAYVAAVVTLAVGYPTVRGALLQRAYLAIELAVLCVSIGFALQWLSRRERWTPETLVTGLLIALQAAMITGGPYRFAIFTAWDRAWAVLLVMYASLIILEGWVWSRSTRS